MASVADEEPLAPVAYALTFLVSIIMVKSLIALAFDRTRGQSFAQHLQSRSFTLWASHDSVRNRLRVPGLRSV